MPPAAAKTTLDLIGTIALWLILLGIIGWGLWRWLKKSDDPGKLVFKWILTALLLIVFFGKVLPLVAKGGYVGAFGGVPAAAVCGLCGAIIWRRSIAATIAKPFGDLYDGGDEAPIPQACYSSAEAKRKRGQFPEALADIRKQLDKFPTDFTGQMLQAEIQAENFNDLPAAALTVQRICNQPNHAARNIAYAFNTLADWQLKYALDPDAAREALEQIVARLPNSELALLAEQRIGHLANRAQLTASHDRARVAVPLGAQNIGLMASSAHLAPAGPDLTARAGELVQHLEQHPHDAEAREQLAVIYADHYHRLDLAAEQLTQLINQPNQPARNVIRWLNLLADLQIRHDCTYEAVAQTLAQVIARYPNHAAANLARNRLDLLRLEIKSKQAPRAIKLGTYEQNIGLKQGSGGGVR